jgi:hypothetical protein
MTKTLPRMETKKKLQAECLASPLEPHCRLHYRNLQFAAKQRMRNTNLKVAKALKTVGDSNCVADYQPEQARFLVPAKSNSRGENK